MRLVFMLLLPVLLLLVGCAARPALPTTRPVRATSPSPVETPAIIGTLVYRDPLGLPIGTRARVLLIDLAEPAAEPVARLTLAPLPASPVPFVLPYDPAALVAGRAYALQARVETASGELLAINTSVYPVLGPGEPRRADMIVERVR